jgi:hypothetical protein
VHQPAIVDLQSPVSSFEFLQIEKNENIGGEHFYEGLISYYSVIQLLINRPVLPFSSLAFTSQPLFIRNSVVALLG